MVQGVVTEFLGNFVLLCQVARELEVSRMTLWRWVKAGKLQTYRIGREVLIEKAEVERLKAKR